MNKNFTSQSGQAFMELTVMLLILAAMMLAVIMLNGLEISSNTILLSARTNAQEQSQSANPYIENRSDELESWSNSTLDLAKSYIHPEQRGSLGGSTKIYKNTQMRVRSTNTFYIPFSYQGRYIYNSAEGSLQESRAALTSPLYTETNVNNHYDSYEQGGWRLLSDFDRNLHNDFSSNLTPFAFNLAGLVQSSAKQSSYLPVTVNSKDQAGPHSSQDAAHIMYGTFRDLFGVDLTANKLTEHKTNKVFMPQH